jgi:hypothetical protein
MEWRSLSRGNLLSFRIGLISGSSHIPGISELCLFRWHKRMLPFLRASA